MKCFVTYNYSSVFRTSSMVFRVSFGFATLWPIVAGCSKISKSLPPLKSLIINLLNENYKIHLMLTLEVLSPKK